MRLTALLSDIHGVIRPALDLISPHFEEIQCEWRRKLASFGIPDHNVEALTPLILELQKTILRVREADSFRKAMEEEGQTLERDGVSEAHIAAGLGTYLECCLPYFLRADPKRRKAALALARLISTCQLAVLSSCAAERVVVWRKMQERDRHTISRDLHDDIGHNLLVLKLYLETMAIDLKRGDVAPLQSKLEEALALVSVAVESVRRLMLDLGPAILSQFGFLPAIKIYTRQFTLRTGIQVQMAESAGAEDIPSSYGTALYRILQGALSNIVQHSQAKNVKVRIGAVKSSLLVMSIEDDGAGFEFRGTHHQRAFGLTAMRERVEMLGGKFHIESWPAGPGRRKHGTRIEVDLPLDNGSMM